ncbi:MAG: beta-propeller fold lactonase family protein [Ruthenibacterium lactatiformans]
MQLPSVCGWITGKKGVIIRHYGHGADPVRQSAPHPHAAVWAPDGKYVIVADLGTDDLTVYRVDRENRVLCADAVHSFCGQQDGSACLCVRPKGRTVLCAL